MSLENFYTIIGVNRIKDGALAQIKLNPVHEIYKGHFPDMAVVPGVCQMHMINHVLEVICQRNLKMSAAKQMKFFRPISPNHMDVIRLELKFKDDQADNLLVNASIFAEEELCFKLRGIFSDLYEKAPH